MSGGEMWHRTSDEDPDAVDARLAATGSTGRLRNNSIQAARQRRKSHSADEVLKQRVAHLPVAGMDCAGRPQPDCECSGPLAVSGAIQTPVHGTAYGRY